MSPRCEHPADDTTDVTAECGRPSVWETDDLGNVHHLCDAHCVEAFTHNTFSYSAAAER